MHGIPVYDYITICPLCWTPSLFLVFAVRNNSAINICVQLLGYVCKRISEIYTSSTSLDIAKLLSTVNVLIILTAVSMRLPVFSYPHQTWSCKTFNLFVKCCLIVLNCTFKITTEIGQQIILKRPNAITFRQNFPTAKHHFHTLFVILFDAYTSLSSSTGLHCAILTVVERIPGARRPGFAP